MYGVLAGLRRGEGMTKQEEIREGIANRLVWWKDAICHMVEVDKNPNADSPMTIAKLISQDLVDAGVVIKVDRELPACPISEVLTGNQQAIGCPYFKAGYVAVESLIGSE